MYESMSFVDASSLKAMVGASGFQAIVSTLLLLAVVFVARTLLGRAIKRRVGAVDLRRRWLVQTRNGLLLLLLLGLVVIWGSELRTLALSLVALAVAFVVATKELILCVTGTILKTGARSFTVGDRIQIKDIRGDVIDQNLLATTIMEIGPGKLSHQRTGRVIVIPNALFVGEPVINESYTHDFVLHVFTVPFKREDDWRAAQEALLKAAQRQSAPYMADVRRHMKRISDNRGLDTPSVEPRVTFQIPIAGEVHLIVRVPAQASRRGYVEQAILAECFAHTHYAKSDEAKSDEQTVDSVSNDAAT